MIYKNLNKNIISKIFKKQMEELIIIKDQIIKYDIDIFFIIDIKIINYNNICTIYFIVYFKYFLKILKYYKNQKILIQY